MPREITLPPNIIDHIQELEERVRVLERAPRYVGQSVPAVPLGAVRDFGFSSIDATSYTEVFRSDVWLTAPILDYHIQTSDVWATSAPTSIDWQITAYDESNASYFVSAGSSGTPQEFFGTRDLTTIIGPEVLFRPVRIDVEVRRTGGAGDAAIRLVRPLIIRTSEG